MLISYMEDRNEVSGTDTYTLRASSAVLSSPLFSRLTLTATSRKSKWCLLLVSLYIHLPLLSIYTLASDQYPCTYLCSVSIHLPLLSIYTLASDQYPSTYLCSVYIRLLPDKYVIYTSHLYLSYLMPWTLHMTVVMRFMIDLQFLTLMISAFCLHLVQAHLFLSADKMRTGKLKIPIL